MSRKYTVQDMEEKYGTHFTGTARGRLYILAALAQAHSELDRLEEALTFERKVNDRVNEIFKGWFHREG